MVIEDENHKVLQKQQEGYAEVVWGDLEKRVKDWIAQPNHKKTQQLSKMDTGTKNLKEQLNDTQWEQMIAGK